MTAYVSSWSSAWRGLYILVLTGCMVVQAGHLYISIYKGKGDRSWRVEALTEGILLLHIVLQTLYLVRLQYEWQTGGFYVPNILLRYYIQTFLALLFGCALYIPACRRYILLPLALLLPALPQIQSSGNPFMPYVQLAAMAGIFIRAVLQIVVKTKKLEYSLSVFAIREAVNRLGAALMFCDLNGRILLMNYRMEEMMQKLGDCVYKDGLEFIEDLESGETTGGKREPVFGDEMVYHLEDGTVWRFQKERIGRDREYIQLYAMDMGEEWRFIKQLSEDNARLQKKSERIKEEIRQMQELCRQEELLRARSRIHDLIGQRISMLLQVLREQKEPDEDTLYKLDHMIELALTKEEGRNVEEELSHLQKSIQSLGIAMDISGSFPKRQELAELFMDMITEGVSNAIRHGFADIIRISMEEHGRDNSLYIENNGQDKEEFREGGGISQMRKKAEQMGGKFRIARAPFRIYVRVPKDGVMEQEVQDDKVIDCG